MRASAGRRRIVPMLVKALLPFYAIRPEIKIFPEGSQAAREPQP